MEGESGVIPDIIHELHSSGIQRDEMEGESGVPRSVIGEIPSSGLVKWKIKVVLLEVSTINFFLPRR